MVVIGWLFSIIARPLGEPAFLMNLLAALCAALAAGGTVVVSRRLGLPLPVGVAAAAGFALTPVVWHISTAIDAHALHAAGRIEERTPGAVARAAALARTPLPPFCPEVF